MSLGFWQLISKSPPVGPEWSFSATRIELARRLTGRRFMHSVRVAHTAAALARLYGADPVRAYTAGILHDCARDMPGDKLVQTATAGGLNVTMADRWAPVVLHGRVGALVAQRDFGTDDAELLAAIAYHVTGPPAGSVLADVLFVADYVEPGRCFPGVGLMRTLATTELEAAVRFKFTHTREYLGSRGRPFHPDSEAALRTREDL